METRQSFETYDNISPLVAGSRLFTQYQAIVNGIVNPWTFRIVLCLTDLNTGSTYNMIFTTEEDPPIDTYDVFLRAYLFVTNLDTVTMSLDGTSSMYLTYDEDYEEGE